MEEKGKIIVKKITAVLGFIAIFIVALVAVGKQNTEKIKNFSVTINALIGDNFLNEEEIKSILIGKIDSFVQKPISSVSLAEIEAVIETEPEVKNAEAFISIGGELEVQVELKTMVVRVKPEKGNGYYIDKEGNVMRWVSSCTPRVLTASGWIKRYEVSSYKKLTEEDREAKLNSDLYAFATAIFKDKFWSKQLVQIYINYDGDAEAITLVGDQKIILGSLEGGKQKLEKLMLYYKGIVNKVGWLKYKEVNLKFDHQIVCK